MSTSHNKPSHYETRLIELLGGAPRKLTTRERWQREARVQADLETARIARERAPFPPLFSPVTAA
jgi:hypothetical protein